jgi:hypothetical protein
LEQYVEMSHRRIYELTNADYLQKLEKGKKVQSSLYGASKKTSPSATLILA